MLKIKNLTATLQNQEILHDLNLEVKKNEVHAIIGPSKSGKSALTMLLAGMPFIEIEEGTISFKNKKINNKALHERSQSGILCAFQDLIEVPNVTNWELLVEILKARKDTRDLTTLKEYYDFLCDTLKLGSSHGLKEANSDGLNFGEAMKNELLMMFMLNPTLAIIDEVDEKLNEEDTNLVVAHIQEMAHSGERATIVFSKDKAVLEAINPTHVHVMVDGKLVLSGGKELLQRIEEDGYSELSTS